MLPYSRKDPLPFPFFEAVTALRFSPDYLTRERQEFKEEGKPQVSLPFCPRRGRGSLTRSAERSSLLRFSENLPARTGCIANATRVPHKPVQKRRCPDRVNRLRGSGVQPSLCRKMGAQKISDKTKQARIKPSLLCCDREV